jgi:molecular chaperone DnaJ
MTASTHYDALGVEHDASDKDIKTAYRKLALKLHPDKCAADKKDEYEAEFKKVSVAYDVLSNPKKRQEYDMQLQGGGDGMNGQSIHDLFKNMNMQGSNIFNFFNSNGGDILSVHVNLSLEDVVMGVTKQVKYMRIEFCNTCSGRGYENDIDTIKCPHCNGTGQIDRVMNMGFFHQVLRDMCSACKATGKMIIKQCQVCHGKLTFERENTVKIKIIPGVKHNDSIRLRKKGNQVAPGVYTDLNIIVKVTKHKVYERIGETDLRLRVAITLPEALCGFEKDVPFLDGTTIPIVSKNIIHPDTVTIIQGKGVYKTGDLHIVYKIEFPTNLSTFMNQVYEKNMDAVNALIKQVDDTIESD